MTRPRSIGKLGRQTAFRRRAKSVKGEVTLARSALRKSGIRIFGDMPWGAHLCVFYETKQDLLEIAAAYFEAGLNDNEFCVWAVSEPITVPEAKNFLRRNIADFNAHLAAGRIELLAGHQWYLKSDRFDLKKITAGWNEKLQSALTKGFAGMRVSGNAFWMESKHREDFFDYERALEASMAGQNMIGLCTYSLRASRAIDVMDVARAHQHTIARRNGEWEFLETPELRQARDEIKRLRGGLDILSKPFPGHERLTPRERVVLAQIVRGASSKEAGRTLGVSPRTVEFHRANIMQKFGTKNVVDLLTRVLGQAGDSRSIRR